MTQTNNKADGCLHVAIVGAGAAGMACALEAAEKGARVTLIEHRGLGVTSPSAVSIWVKLLRRAAQNPLAQPSNPFASAMSSTTPSVERDIWLALQRRHVEAICERRLAALVSSPHIKLMEGEARFLDKDKLIVRLNDDSRKLSFRKVRFDCCLIASGSIPDIPPIPGLAGTPYWTAAEALATPRVPPRLLVIGASYPGLELAQAFARLGSKVTMLVGGGLGDAEEPAIDAALMEVFAAWGIEVLQNVEVGGAAFEDGVFMLGTNRGEMRAERVLVASGRIPNTYSLCLDMIGVKLGPEGHVLVDERLQTNVPGIYAAGDCAGMPPSLRIGAEEAGRLAAINMISGASDPGVMP